MGRIVVANFMSMDGVIRAPLSPDEDRDGGFSHGGWVPPYSDQTVNDVMERATVDAAGMLLGRRSYEILRGAWAEVDETEPAIAAMNRMPKYVVSSSPLEPGGPNSHLVDADLPSTANELKRRTDGDLVVFGSGTLVRGLAEHDLVDEYRLLLFPIVLGAGKRMFDEHAQLATFEVRHHITTATGVVALTYTRRDTA
jgi:dihydrofolate reductase